jgi:hypothetical protein
VSLGLIKITNSSYMEAKSIAKKKASLLKSSLGINSLVGDFNNMGQCS